MFLLEPLSCLLRLATLQFMPHGTKIGIEGSRIQLFSSWRLQPFVRWYSGSSRDDLYFILRPVVAAKMRFNTKNEDLCAIMLHAALGLRCLQKTYAIEANTAGQCLKLYAQYLTGEAEIDPDELEVDDFSGRIYAEYMRIWKAEELTIARSMLDMAAQVKEEDTKASWVRALSEILNSKEEAARKILARLTKGITKDTKEQGVP